MPVIQFTQADFLRSKVLDPSWQPVSVKEIKAEPSSKGNSINYIITFVLDEKSGAPGKEIQQYFNSMAISSLIPLCSAALNRELKPGDPVDLDQVVGKKFDAHLYIDNYNGQNNNKCDNFLPLGRGTSAMSAF